MVNNLCLLFVSLCLTTLLCELLARQFLPVRKVGPGLTQYDPSLGKIHKKGIRVTQRSSEFQINLAINSLGFRGPEITTPLPNQIPVVLFLGDSFTMGDGVSDGEEFPQIIARDLRSQFSPYAIQTINAGIADTGTARALRFLKQYASDWRNPTVLVYQFSPNDFLDNVREGFYFVDNYGRLIERDTPAAKSWMWELQPFVTSIPGLSRSHLFTGFRELMARMGREGAASGDMSSTRDQGLLTFKLVEELLSFARSREWPVLGLVFGLSKYNDTRIRGIFEDFNVTTVRLPGRTVRPDLYYQIDVHWNQKGHAYVAQSLLPHITEKISELIAKP